MKPMPRTVAPESSVAAPPLLLPSQRLGLPYAAVLFLGMLLIGLFCVHQVGNTDTGFHLKAGRYILENHSWPRNDSFTFTLNDRPYVDMTWGYQVLLALAQRWFDAAGMIALNTAFVLGAFVLTYRTIRLSAVDPLTLSLLLPLGGIACAMRYEIRPEMLSLLLLAAMMHILVRHAEGRRSPLWALPLIQLMWANCHAFFMLGWAAMGAFAIGLCLRDRRFDGRLLRWAVLAMLACLLNPYGVRGVTFPLTLLTRFDQSNVFSQSISELASPFALRTSARMPFVPYWPIYSFRLISILSLISLVPAWRARRYWAMALWLIFMTLAAKMMRNMPLLVITSLPMIAWSLPLSRTFHLIRLGRTARRAAGIGTLTATALILVALSLRVVHNAYYIDRRMQLRFGSGWNRLELPIDAADYVNRVGLKGPAINHLNFGGYLMWALPDPVFIDGRLEVVGEKFYKRYLAILDSQTELEAAVREYGIRWMIFPYAICPQLLARMSGDSRWRLAYVDHLAAIFIRNEPDLQSCVDPALARLRAPKLPRLDDLPGLGGPPRPGPARRWLDGVFHGATFPTEDYTHGLFHFYRQELPQAEARYAAAIRASEGRFYEMYNNLGAVLYRGRKSVEAARCYRIVLEDDPTNPLARQRAGMVSPPRGPSPGG